MKITPLRILVPQTSLCAAANEYQEFIIEGADFDKYTDLWYTRLDKYYTQFL